MHDMDISYYYLVRGFRGINIFACPSRTDSPSQKRDGYRKNIGRPFLRVHLWIFCRARVITKNIERHLC